MDRFDQILLSYGLNSMYVGFILWSLCVEIPSWFVLSKRLKQVRAATLHHLNTHFPSVWNFNPSSDVEPIDRAQWLELSGLAETATLEYTHGVDKAKLAALLIFACAMASGSYWIFALSPIVVTTFLQGKVAGATRISQTVFDLKEQAWISRNRQLNTTPSSTQMENLPTDFPSNPLKPL